jgi:malate dehydrogenase (oxaloacetate-decarboxylating)
MTEEGLTKEQARGQFWLVNSKGVLHSGRRDLTPEQMIYAQPENRIANWPRSSNGNVGLADVIAQIDATILIGLSTVAGAFSEKLVREMGSRVERPIIFPLSNPTSKSEATPEDLTRWTEGRALVATGSPFAPVNYDGRTIPVAQCNNVYIFPAIGLGVVASRARRITDAMLLAAARTLAANSPAVRDPSASLLPPLTDLRRVAGEIAVAVGIAAQKDGFAPQMSGDEVRARVTATQWTPDYPSYCH